MRRIGARSSRFSLDRTFPDGALVRLSSGKSFEVRFETKRE